MEIGEGDSLKGYSPEHLQALSLGCMMKMNNLFSKVYSVGMNPEEVVLSGGSCADLALWFNEMGIFPLLCRFLAGVGKGVQQHVCK